MWFLFGTAGDASSSLFKQIVQTQKNKNKKKQIAQLFEALRFRRNLTSRSLPPMVLGSCLLTVTWGQKSNHRPFIYDQNPLGLFSLSSSIPF